MGADSRLLHLRPLGQLNAILPADVGHHARRDKAHGGGETLLLQLLTVEGEPAGEGAAIDAGAVGQFAFQHCFHIGGYWRGLNLHLRSLKRLQAELLRRYPATKLVGHSELDVRKPHCPGFDVQH